MSVPSYHLGAKLTNPFGKSLYQFGFGPFAGVRGPQGINTPPLRLTTCDQSPDANDFMKRMFGEAWPQGVLHLRFARQPHVQHPSGRHERSRDPTQ
jgi:hypothetical protein